MYLINYVYSIFIRATFNKEIRGNGDNTFRVGIVTWWLLFGGIINMILSLFIKDLQTAIFISTFISAGLLAIYIFIPGFIYLEIADSFSRIKVYTTYILLPFISLAIFIFSILLFDSFPA